MLLTPSVLRPTCLDVHSHAHMLVSLLICSMCFMPSSVCLYTLCHVCVPRPRPCLSCHVSVVCFLPNGSDPSALPSCICLFVFMIYACVSLSYFRLCHVWHPPRAWSCLVTLDSHDASFGCNHLGCVFECRVAPCVPFPFSAPHDVMLTKLVCATRWFSMYLCTLAYMSMHESCLLVCRTRFNTMNLWTFNPNLH